MAELRERIGWSRLVTVVGPGGAGKTRLVREAVAGILRECVSSTDFSVFPDGALWVELAPVRSGDDVPGTLARLLDLSPSSDRPVADAIADALRSQQLLVVFDNCEHVIHEVALLADTLLRSAPHLSIVATSREALAIEGEVAWQVPGLERWKPSDDSVQLDAARALGYDAIRLFVERARASTPLFALTDTNAPAVASICSRLDGLPLALELAAAVVPLLGVEGLVARLDDAMTLLVRGRRTALPRHRTLRAVLDWSYGLLGNEERTLLCRLSVFRGAFSIDDVEEVCGSAIGDEPGIDILPALGRLVELSLMEVREEDGETNYRLLETVRQYGSELLRLRANAHLVRRRHALWVADAAERLEPLTFSAARGRTVALQRRNIEEIRAAMHWATSQGGEPMLAVRIAGLLGWYWISAHPWADGRQLLELTLAAADAEGIPDAERSPDDRLALARMMYPLLGLAYFAGDTGAMLSVAARDIALWDSVDADAEPDDCRKLASARGRTLCYQLLGLAHTMRGERELASHRLGLCISTAESSGDKWLLAVMIMRRALALSMMREHAAAHADYVTAVPQLRELKEYWFLSLALEGMAINAAEVGKLAAAGAYACESVKVLQAEPDAWFISRSLDAIAFILEQQSATGQGGDRSMELRTSTAARLMGAASGLRRRCGVGVIGPDVVRHEQTLLAVRTRAGLGKFNTSFAEGERLTLDDVFHMMNHDSVIKSLERVDDTPASLQIGTSATTISLEISVLGNFSMAVDGNAMPDGHVPAGKVMELLLFLLLHRTATKDEIGLALWPDATAAQVRNLFHVTLHHLRKALGTRKWIAFDRNFYRFDRAPEPGCHLELDVDAVLAASLRLRTHLKERTVLAHTDLSAAHAALDRHRGPFAMGMVMQDWIVSHQDRIDAAWADGMDALAQIAHRQGQYDDAAEALESLLRREPLREGAHRLYIETLAARGEPARALAHFERLSELLQTELGAMPARETRATVQRLLG